MIACGTLNGFEDVQAVIKSKVGDFLIAERRLQALTRSPSVSIQSRAQALLVAQKAIEGDLGTAQANITKFQSGAWTFGDMAEVGDVALRLTQHLNNVNALERDASGVSTLNTVGMSKYLPYVAIGAAALLVLGVKWPKG